jgi:hypothetical protein
VTTAKEVTVNTVVFTGCKSTAFGGKECQNENPTTKKVVAGEIITNPLKGELDYPAGTKTKHNQAAIDLSPAKLTGGEPIFVVFKCKTLLKEETVTVRGSVICPIETVNTAKQKHFTLSCKGKAGVQEPVELETEAGKPTKDILETKGEGQEVFAYAQSAEIATFEIEVQKEMEIKA